MKLTPLQHRVLQLIYRSPMGQCSLTRLGRVYKTWPGNPVIGRLAAHSIMLALRRRGLVGMFRSGDDRWSTIIVFCTDEGQAWTPMRPPVS